MATLEDIGLAAIRRDSLRLRSIVQDFMENNPDLAAVARPSLEDTRALAAAASIVELLALRSSQPAPAWTRQVGPLKEPFYLLASAETMPRLRRKYEQDAPEHLRKRRLYAPEKFLTWERSPQVNCSHSSSGSIAAVGNS